MATKSIRVLLVDDSPLALVFFQRLLATSEEVEVAGVAANGRQALELIPRLQPEVICTDYHMPDMNGLQLVREVMERFPRPILVVSSAVEANDSDRIFSLLEAGAVDVFPKPRGGPLADQSAAESLINKIKIVAGVRVHGRKKSLGPSVLLPPPPVPYTKGKKARFQIVVIGASTGGPQALQTILSNLPANFPTPILCVQHISAGFLEGLISWLGNHFKGRVKMAGDNETPLSGHVYFPQENSHLLVDRQGRLRLSHDLPVQGHRPSVSVTFRSVADQFGDAAIGVLLTGMGHDGGEGMQRLAEAGAWTICQDEATSVIYGMPRDAVERGAARAVLPLGEIAAALISATSDPQPRLTEKTKHGSA